MVHIRLQTLLYTLVTYLSDDGATSCVGNSWATEINGENRSERMHRSSFYLQSNAVGGGSATGKPHWASTKSGRSSRWLGHLLVAPDEGQLTQTCRSS